MRANQAIRADLHPSIDHGISAKCSRRVHFRLRMDDGRWMNHGPKSGPTALVAKSKLQIAFTFGAVVAPNRSGPMATIIRASLIWVFF